GIPIPESPLLRADLEEEEYPADPSVATVTRTAWSPHEIELAVEAKTDTRSFVNQNWSEHWTSNVGAVVEVDRLLAIDVPAGAHHVKLRYRDGTSLFCLAISLGALGVFLFFMGKSGVAVL